jgi:hypothetical protein
MLPCRPGVGGKEETGYNVFHDNRSTHCGSRVLFDSALTAVSHGYFVLVSGARTTNINMVVLGGSKPYLVSERPPPPLLSTLRQRIVDVLSSNRKFLSGG